MGTTAHNIWDYIGSAKCTVVCFESANSLNAVMRTTSVLRGVNMHWSPLGFSKCAEYGRLGHISLGCTVGGNLSSEKPSHRPFLDIDKSRLATIYAKHLALIAHPVAFGGVFWAKIAVSINSGFFLEMKPILPDMSDVEKRFAVLESSLASLVEQISELAKRLNSFMLANWVSDIVIKESLGETTSGETTATLDSFASLEVKRLKNMLKRLSASVLSLIARFNGSILAGIWKIATYNVRGLNNSAKQHDIINKFDSVWVFTSGLYSGHLGSDVAIIMDNSLAKHVYKLLFKNNLSVSILGLHAGASLVVQFSQAGEINSLIAKTVNEFSFVILGGDFNENETQKCASFKNVANVEDYFDTNYKAVYASMGLGGLFDIYLGLIYKQVNKDCWKFDVKSADEAK
ncbi:hypothetical protein G9A89_018906 [Geosiphon pyriformis]|nr:hypothetical protein G9A89_018906 [Geosiphon pyriformis]